MGNREAVMTRERPIIFSAAMVRAILDGRKTQTRRIVKPQPMWDVAPLEYANAPGWWAPNEAEDSRKSPYRVGDVFYVRESARCSITASGEHVVTYRADGAIRVCGVDTDAYEGYGTFYGNVCPSGEEKKDDGAIVGPWRPSIHVPRWAARINLRVTGVRVELVQSISEADAIAEGLFEWTDPPRIATKHYGIGLPDVWETDPRKAFKRLWCSIHGPGAWERNDWVWANTFERIGDDA